MTEYQTYGIDAAGIVTHGGVTKAKRMTPRLARRIQREWEKWRIQYLADHPGDYPLRHCPPTVALRAHPLGRPQECREYRFRVTK